MDGILDIAIDVLADATKDTLYLVPFLLVVYLAMEWLEHKAGDATQRAVRRAGAAGPFVGAILGAFPQCGFSAMGATLYAGRVITLGTLFAVFLSTSDELLPMMIAEKAPLEQMLAIMGAKVIIGMVMGFAVDLALRLRKKPEEPLAIHKICARDHCECSGECATCRDNPELTYEHDRVLAQCTCECDHHEHRHGHGRGDGHEHEHEHDHECRHDYDHDYDYDYDYGHEQDHGHDHMQVHDGLEGAASDGAADDYLHCACEHEHAHGHGGLECAASDGVADDHLHCACEHEHAHQHTGTHIVKSACKHTVKVTIFVWIISLAISALFAVVGEDALASILNANPVASVLASGVVGLIPNCAASVAIVQLYLEGVLSTGAMMAGLLVSAGVGLLVLCRTNGNARQNALIILALYATGVVWGFAFLVLGISF